MTTVVNALVLGTLGLLRRPGDHPVGADARIGHRTVAHQVRYRQLYVSGNGGMLVSLAVLVTVSSVNSLIVCVGLTGNTGPLFTSRTITVKLLVAVSLRIDQVIRIAVGHHRRERIYPRHLPHRRRPADHSVRIDRRPHRPRQSIAHRHRVDVRLAAVLVTTTGVNPLIVTSVWPGNTGAAFTSRTVTIKLFVAFKLPSLTTVVNRLVPGLWPAAASR